MSIRDKVVQPYGSTSVAVKTRELARSAQLFDEIATATRAVVFADTPYAADSGADVLILCDSVGGNIVVNLPASASIVGRHYWVKKTNTANIVTVTPNGSETVDGAATHVLAATTLEGVHIVNDGSNWHILAGV